MSFYPTPLIPAALPQPILPDPHTAVLDGFGGYWVESPAGRVGAAWPPVRSNPAGRWFTKQPGQAADVHPDMVAALAFLAACDPHEIRFEETR